MTPSEPEWRRLHPSSMVLRAAAYARKLVLPAVFVLVLARNSSWELWLLIAFIPAVAFEFFRYFTLRYRFGPGELIVRKGLIFRSERHIPFARIQNINLLQGVLHRWLGVADVSIETAGGKEPEAVLKVLSVDAVGQMRRRVFRENGSPPPETGGVRAGDAGAQPEPAASRPEIQRALILHLSPRELAVLGLITVRGLALMAVVIGIGWELDLWDQFNVRQWIDERVAQGISTLETAAALAGVIVGIPLLAGLSIAWCLLRFYDYRLEADGDDLHISGGLLTRRSATIPRHRIQLVTIRESLMHRLFGRVSVRVETAAGASEEDEEAKDRLMAQRWFIPIVRREDSARILRQVLPRLDLKGIAWRPLPPKARGRMMRKNAILAFLLATPVAWFFWPWGLAAGVIFPAFGLWHAHRSAAYIGWDHAPFGVAYRSGVLTRCVSVTFPDKVQVVSVRQTPFDRRYGMASLRVDTAGAGPANHQVRIPFLNRDTAGRLAGVMLQETSRGRQGAVPAEAPVSPVLDPPALR